MDFSKIRTYSIRKRPSKVNKKFFARPLRRGSSFRAFLGSLPSILRAQELKAAVHAVVAARKKSKPVIFMMGAHVIKCGLSPLVIELIKRDVITSVAFNGAGLIHDFEIAFCGQTSEDVVSALKDGRFGMVRETADFINGAATEGAGRTWGFGYAVAEKIARERLRYRDLSIAYQARKKGIPLTVHVALGTDIVHQHPSCSGADTGEVSLRDFRTFASQVARIGSGGVAINMGSAVIMPEVFLKALTVARNLRYPVRNFTTVNFDMIRHYRPQENFVSRPVLNGGRGFYIVGHHEIMLPLFAGAVLEEMGARR